MLNLKKKCVPLRKQLLQLFDGVKYCNASMHDFYRVPGNVLIFSSGSFPKFSWYLEDFWSLLSFLQLREKHQRTVGAVWSVPGTTAACVAQSDSSCSCRGRGYLTMELVSTPALQDTTDREERMSTAAWVRFVFLLSPAEISDCDLWLNICW